MKNTNNINEILQERGANYGDFTNFSLVSQQLKFIKNDYLATNDEVINEGLDMILHKIARILNGNPTYKDSWVDIAGYATLVAGYLDKKEKTETKDEHYD